MYASSDPRLQSVQNVAHLDKSWSSSVPAPISFRKSLQLRDKLLMIPGPTNMHPRVLQAMSTPILSHTDPQFYKLLAEIQNGIRYLFQTNAEYTFALTGSGTSAMEATLCNLLLPGQRLLSLAAHGHWGERVAMMGERMALDVIRLKQASVGEVFTLQQIEDALFTFRPTMMYVCHGDSSLGTLQPLDGIGRLCRKYECLLMVDAVVSLCSAPVAMDLQQIDILYSAAQKALSGPPGVSLISLSERAVEQFKARVQVQPVASFYMDFGLVAKAWGTGNNKNYLYHYTHAINLLYGLREAISLVVEQGLSTIVQRHLDAKADLESKLTQMGLQFLVANPAHRLPGIMSVIIPDDIDGAKVINYLYERHDILIGGSLLAANLQVPKFWRLGFLGINANPEAIAKLCSALREALQHQRSLKSRL